MEIRAYNELYVPLAQRVLGDMFDFAIVTLGYDASFFASVFMVSDIASQIAIGNPAYVAGRTGCEIVRLVLEASGLPEPEHPDEMFMDKSPEFWAGWALAYYQWKSGLDFRRILSIVPYTDIVRMYHPYHEMDIEKFADAMDDRMLRLKQKTRLAHYRNLLGMSQSELSGTSGVALRQIQLFEQRQRDINRAQADTLCRLSKALCCSMEDLLE